MSTRVILHGHYVNLNVKLKMLDFYATYKNVSVTINPASAERKPGLLPVNVGNGN
jgi:hypothetical protein